MCLGNKQAGVFIFEKIQKLGKSQELVVDGSRKGGNAFFK